MTIGMSDAAFVRVGRVTVAASQLEVMLSWFAAERNGVPWEVIFTKPGEPLRAAKAALDRLDADERDRWEYFVTQAGELLRKRHTAVHALWVAELVDGSWRYSAEHVKSGVVNDAESEVFEELAVDMEALSARYVYLSGERSAS